MPIIYPAEKYQARCHKLFKNYAQHIRMLLPDAVIEHIGASSIENAWSKGDLDIYVAVQINQFELCIELLCENLNFQEKLDTLRTHDLCMLESLNDDNVAIQLVVHHSQWCCLFLDFRDALRKSTQLVEQYNTLKQESSPLDMQRYRERKSAFIEKVLQNGHQAVKK